MFVIPGHSALTLTLSQWARGLYFYRSCCRARRRVAGGEGEVEGMKGMKGMKVWEVEGVGSGRCEGYKGVYPIPVREQAATKINHQGTKTQRGFERRFTASHGVEECEGVKSMGE